MEFNTDQLNIIFPFYVIIDESLTIQNFGSSLKKISPAIEKEKELSEFLILQSPFIPFTYTDIEKKEKQLFLFSIKEKDLQLKGQVLCLNNKMLFILSPVISDLAVLKKAGITLKDFAIYDSMTDNLFLLNAQKMALNESKQFYSQLLETNKKLETVNKEIAEINTHLEQKVIERTKEIQKTLNDLKAAQAQLVQSEKMASLGELTAGIAHEIQNPLNFVNNFSEVNKEMLEELKAERLKPKAERDDETQDELINDVIANEEKINHHGKRADAIVKGMLQHSRASSGQKEPADINALCDEYLRLSYHGLRARDKSFNAEMTTGFDENIGKISIVPQDIGRVLLNLFNNAFYACAEKSRAIVNQQKEGNSVSYQPAVWVSTKKAENHVIITVTDNGGGIPEKIKDKIFQPFFTTKPTGQGTGLGLSLSYDIVKAHWGEMKVESEEGEGTKFIIELPL